MAATIQIARVLTGAPPPGRLAEGVLGVEMATPGSPRLWVGVPSAVDGNQHRQISLDLPGPVPPILLSQGVDRRLLTGNGTTAITSPNWGTNAATGQGITGMYFGAGGNNQPYIDLAHGGGNVGAPQATALGDVIGSYLFSSYFSPTAKRLVAGMAARALENHTASAGGTEIVFQTTPSGSATQAATLIVGQDGNIRLPRAPVAMVSGGVLLRDGATDGAVRASEHLRMDDRWFNLFGAGTDGGACFQSFVRARGTMAARTPVMNDDLLGGLSFGGYYTNANFNYAGVYMVAHTTENWSAAGNGAEWRFMTCPNGQAHLYQSGLRPVAIMRQDGHVDFPVHPLRVASGGTGTRDFPMSTEMTAWAGLSHCLPFASATNAFAHSNIGNWANVPNGGRELTIVGKANPPGIGLVPYIHLMNFRGAPNNPQPLQFGDLLGILSFGGSHAAGFPWTGSGDPCSISCSASAAWSATHAGVNLHFTLKPANTVASRQAMQLENSANGSTLTVGDGVIVPRSHLTISGGAVAWWSWGRYSDWAGIWVRGTDLEHQFGGGCVAAYFTPTSDIRLKENVAPYTRGLAEICALQPCSWQWQRRTGERRTYGLTAQDVETVIPEAVYETDAPVVALPEDASEEARAMHALPSFKTVDMMVLIDTLINAVKELDGRVTALNGRGGSAPRAAQARH